MLDLIVKMNLVHEEGSTFEGELSSEGLLENEIDPVFAFCGPIHYRIEAHHVGESAHIRLWADVEGKAKCATCSTDFTYPIHVDGYDLFFETVPPNRELFVGDELREEILVQIPEYPHCPKHAIATEETAPVVESKMPSGALAWSALDDLSAEMKAKRKKSHKKNEKELI